MGDEWYRAWMVDEWYRGVCTKEVVQFPVRVQASGKIFLPIEDL
jgi:hypothetical protein